MTEVSESILLSIKKLNNVAPGETAFDNDITMYINSALSDLNQLGVGPSEGYAIVDEGDLWEDFLGEDPRYNAVKTFVGLKVNLFFDPPNNSFGINMKEKQIEEHAVRLMMMQDDIDIENEVEPV